MAHSVDPSIVDLLEWVGPDTRPYADVIAAWRASCPHFPIWEEANARGLPDRRHESGRGAPVALSAKGRVHLDEFRALRPERH